MGAANGHWTISFRGEHTGDYVRATWTRPAGAPTAHVQDHVQTTGGGGQAPAQEDALGPQGGQSPRRPRPDPNMGTGRGNSKTDVPGSACCPQVDTASPPLCLRMTRPQAHDGTGAPNAITRPF